MDRLLVKTQHKLKVILQQHILMCESDDCYCTLHLMSGEELVICKSLTKLMKELNPELFVRISQTYLVNKDFISSIDNKRKMVELSGNREVKFTLPLKKLVELITI